MTMYTVQFTGVAVTAQQDLIAVVAASTGILWIHGFELSQSTEVGDAQEENLSILVKRGATSAGSGGGAFTPVPVSVNAGASGFTARINDTTPAGTGTIVNWHATNWNIRSSPFQWIYTPEMRPMVAPSERLVIGLATTPADSITMSGTLWAEELR